MFIDWLPDVFSPFPSFLGSKHVRRTEEGARDQCPLGRDDKKYGADDERFTKKAGETERMALVGRRKQTQKLESRVGVGLVNHGVLKTPNSRPYCPGNPSRYSLSFSSLLLVELSDLPEGQISMDSLILPGLWASSLLLDEICLPSSCCVRRHLLPPLTPALAFPRPGGCHFTYLHSLAFVPLLL